LSVPELTVPEQPASEQSASNLTTNSQSTTNIQTDHETSTNDQPPLSYLAIQSVAPAKTNVPSPPILFLHSTFLANVCEGIFQEVNNLVQARNNLIHEDNYEKMWTKLQEWLKGVVSNLHEVRVLRTWVKTPLCLEARSLIPSSIHPRELNLDWLNKINFKEASSELALLQRNTLLEKENKQLKKELVEEKLMLLEYKAATEAQLEEARIRAERLVKSNEVFKQEMKQQSEETQKMMKQMMEMMFQKQDQP